MRPAGACVNAMAGGQGIWEQASSRKRPETDKALLEGWSVCQGCAVRPGAFPRTVQNSALQMPKSWNLDVETQANASVVRFYVVGEASCFDTRMRTKCRGTQGTDSAPISRCPGKKPWWYKAGRAPETQAALGNHCIRGTTTNSLNSLTSRWNVPENSR